ncbi:hypothetical protein Fmac_021648 [Flemingia macrophylla]|uniref:Uncharacterized protein n=1 Tax=Flemingia macrophylla TaxID=520843 RepID=A0ABD1LXK5_9FABA
MEVVFIMTGVCIPSPTRWLLLGLCFAFLKYQADKLMTQFDLKLGKPYDGSKPAVMTMGKAFDEFILEIIDESTIMVCYPLVLLLICPLEPIYQILFLLKLIVAPLYYIPPLLAKASMVGVTYGLLNLPLFMFTTLAAFVLSLIIQFIVLLLIYLNHRCIRATTERPRMGGHEVGMKRFPEQGHVIDINLKTPTHIN